MSDRQEMDCGGRGRGPSISGREPGAVVAPRVHVGPFGPHPSPRARLCSVWILVSPAAQVPGLALLGWLTVEPTEEQEP